MRVRLFADLAETVGSDVVTVDLPAGATAADALDAVVADHPALGDRVLDDDGDLRESINLLVDGEPVTDADAGLDDADEVALFPPVSGG